MKLLSQIMLATVFLFLTVATAQAQVKHKVLRRIAVFPIADANVSSSEDAWWQMREMITKDKRFFVATRRFMVNRGVFQPRKELKPADAIILSKILDAEALVVTWVKERTFYMKVFEGESGYLLWQGESEFHPAVSIADQLIRVSSQMINSFIMALPYQGFEILDENIGKTLFEDKGKTYAKAFVGNVSKLTVGDDAQWIEVQGETNKAYLGETLQVTVIAEGKIASIQDNNVTIEVMRMKDPQDLKENSLVRFPEEMNRLKELYSGGEKASNLSAEYLSGEIKNTEEFKKGHNKTSTALLWIANLAGFLLLAL
jgi:hypothetical protein